MTYVKCIFLIIWLSVAVLAQKGSHYIGGITDYGPYPTPKAWQGQHCITIPEYNQDGWHIVNYTVCIYTDAPIRIIKLGGSILAVDDNGYFWPVMRFESEKDNILEFMNGVH